MTHLTHVKTFKVEIKVRRFKGILARDLSLVFVGGLLPFRSKCFKSCSDLSRSNDQVKLFQSLSLRWQEEKMLLSKKILFASWRGKRNGLFAFEATLKRAR